MIADDDVALDSDRLTETVGRSATTMMIAPTPVWSDLLGEASVTWPRLRAVCYGAIPARSVATELGARTASAWFAHGVTPAGIWTTLNRLNEKDTRDVIGKPLANAALRIVDGDGRDLPIGVVGQLLLRLKDAPRAETAAGQPSAAGPDWIRIGHQARWRGDGAVELLSKRPRETYIDGFRINLDDVASVIRRHPTVEDAEVVLDEAMNPARLMACIVPREGATYSVSELRRELRRNVPAAMVPRSFVEVGSIPRLPDGSAPFELLGVARTGAAGHVPPETPTEQMLADLWADAIGIPKVSVHDNFFALGGYSLLCFQVLDRLERKTGLRVSPRHLLLDTLRQVAAHVDALEGASGRPDADSRRSGAGMFQRLRRLVPGSA
jgi:acyl-CoA synthetase (AMP-forming)/AMP-acid ligase II